MIEQVLRQFHTDCADFRVTVDARLRHRTHLGALFVGATRVLSILCQARSIHVVDKFRLFQFIGQAQLQSLGKFDLRIRIARVTPFAELGDGFFERRSPRRQFVGGQIGCANLRGNLRNDRLAARRGWRQC